MQCVADVWARLLCYEPEADSGPVADVDMLVRRVYVDHVHRMARKGLR